MLAQVHNLVKLETMEQALAELRRKEGTARCKSKSKVVKTSFRPD